MKRSIFISLLVLILPFTTSCKIVFDDDEVKISEPRALPTDDVNDGSKPADKKPKDDGNKIQKFNDDDTKKHGQEYQEQEEKYPEEYEEDEEIIIGHYYQDAIKYNI